MHFSPLVASSRKFHFFCINAAVPLVSTDWLTLCMQPADTLHEKNNQKYRHSVAIKFIKSSWGHHRNCGLTLTKEMLPKATIKIKSVSKCQPLCVCQFLFTNLSFGNMLLVRPKWCRILLSLPFPSIRCWPGTMRELLAVGLAWLGLVHWLTDCLLGQMPLT